MRICSILGQLVRHATVINEEVAQSEFIETLCETLKDESIKVRRKALAALGEFMFYAATQLDDENADPAWKKISNVVN